MSLLRYWFPYIFSKVASSNPPPPWFHVKGLISRYLFQKVSSTIHYGSFLPFFWGRPMFHFGLPWSFFIPLSLNPFPANRFPAVFSKVSSTVDHHYLLPYFEGGAAWAWPISLQNPSLPSLIPCWGIDSIYLLKSLLCHPSLFSHSVLLRRLNSLLLSKYYPSILWWGGFAYFLALLPYPPWFPSLLALSYHTLKGGTAWSISSRNAFLFPFIPLWAAWPFFISL